MRSEKALQELAFKLTSIRLSRHTHKERGVRLFTSARTSHEGNSERQNTENYPKDYCGATAL
jgi:hypothetical protein